MSLGLVHALGLAAAAGGLAVLAVMRLRAAGAGRHAPSPRPEHGENPAAFGGGGLHAAFFKTAMDAMVLLDGQGGVLAANEAFTRLTGYSPLQLKGLDLWRLCPPEEAEAARAAMNRLAGGEKAFLSQTTLQKKEGAQVLAEVGLTPFRQTGRLYISAVFRELRARDEVRQELAAARARFRMLMEQAPFAIEIYRLDGYQAEVNPAWARIFQVETPAEVVGRFNILLDPQSIDKGYAQAFERASRGEPADIPDADFDPGASDLPGRRRYLYTRFFPLRNQEGRVVNVVITNEDITERKEMEAALKNSEERYRLIVGSMSDYVYSATPNQQGELETEWITGAFEAITGYAPYEVMTRPGGFATLLPAEDLEKVLARQPALLKGAPQRVVYRIRTKDGRISWLRDYMRPVLNETGGLKRLLGAVQDITERVNAQQALADSESRLRAIMNNSPSIITLRDRGGVLLMANQRFELLSGQPPRDALGRNARELLPPRTAEALLRHDDELLANLAPLNLEETLVHADGEEHTYLTAKFPILEEGGETVGVCSISTDITQRKKLEERLRVLAATDALTGADNRLAFIGQATAELRRHRRYGAPLTIMYMDIDEFKKVNDTHGHQAGDEVLKKLVQVCLEHLREVDVFGRVGGEEFAVLLPETKIETGKLAAERLARAIEKMRVTHEGSQIAVTVSIGLAQVQDGDKNLDQLLARADAALYQAKREGRNRVRQA